MSGLQGDDDSFSFITESSLNIQVLRMLFIFLLFIKREKEVQKIPTAVKLPVRGGCVKRNLSLPQAITWSCDIQVSLTVWLCRAGDRVS